MSDGTNITWILMAAMAVTYAASTTNYLKRGASNTGGLTVSSPASYLSSDRSITLYFGTKRRADLGSVLT